jgi:LysM repeat protein
MKRLMILTGLIALAGCDTTTKEIQREQVSQRQTIMELQEKQETLNVDLQGTQEENARLRQQIDELRTELESSRRTSNSYAGDIARLDELVQKMNSAREKDRQVILNEVSEELARISQKTAAHSGPSAAPPSKKSSAEEGYEHTVKKGETLFAIAKAYKLPASQIAKANGLKPNAPLKAGQTLFIPKL